MPRKPDARRSIGFVAAPSDREDLTDWGPQTGLLAGETQRQGIVLWQSDDAATEAGLRRCSPGSWRVSLEGDELRHVLAGRLSLRSDRGETIEFGPASVLHLESGWRGECTVHEDVREAYMRCPAPARTQAPRLHALQDPLQAGPLRDWGLVEAPLEGDSRTSGILLHKGPGGHPESGVWVCTPGAWRCHVTSDELCHFLAGHCTYVHESGEVIEIGPDTLALFPRDWKGTCRVHETVRKVYMIH